jgi:hypothetical protein
MIAFLVSFAMGAPSTLVIVDAELDHACYSATTEAVRETARPKDLDAIKQRGWIAQAREAREQARKLALAFQSAEALEKIEEALALFGRGAPALDDFREYAGALIDLGVILTTAGKDAAASQAFRSALVLETGVRPNPKEYTPEVMKRFAKAESELARQARATVAISGRPEGAALYWDGRPIGKMPLSLGDVLLGDHWLTALAPGYRRFSMLVTVQKRSERAEVFMAPSEETGTNEQLALSSALHTGEPSSNELRALTALKNGYEQLIVLARDDSARTTKCAAVQRTESGLLPVTAASPFNVADLLPKKVAKAEPEAPVEIKTVKSGGTHPVLALMPLGIGQFLERRPLVGALFAASQVALLAANLACYFAAQRDRQADGSFVDLARAQGLQVCTNLAVGLLIADVIGGAIEGFLHRSEP